MTSSAATSPADDAYDDVERAVMETARGRWFLTEFARRARAADSSVILGAIDRLEKRIQALADGRQIMMPPAEQPAAAGRPAPSPAAAPVKEQPIEALMARLSAALEETGRDMKAAEGCSATDNAELVAAKADPKTLEEIAKLSPEERLRLFY